MEEQEKYRTTKRDGKFHPEASPILGGQIGDEQLAIIRVHWEAMSVRGSESMLFLQFG